MKSVVIGNATRIYALCEFPSMTPRYVGKTIQSLRLRLVAHLRTARRSPRLPVARWLAKCEREGRQVCIKWIETTYQDWQARERHWINIYRIEGANLLNLTDGGEGLPGHKFSDQHKANIAAALRTGGTYSCIRCGTPFWRKAHEIQKGHNKFCSRKCANVHQQEVRRATA